MSVSEEHAMAWRRVWEELLWRDEESAVYLSWLDMGEVYEEAYSIEWPTEWTDDEIMAGVVRVVEDYARGSSCAM